MKNILGIVLMMIGWCGVAQEMSPLYKDKNAGIEERIEDLIPRMTLEEKILQMNQWTYGKNANPNNIEASMKKVRPEIGSLIYRSTNPKYRNQIQAKAMNESRLGIPIIFGFDAIHGYKTVFPIPLAQACSWDTALVRQSCAISARECWLSGVDWTFSPMVDVARDARWGRVAEGYGEDPYTNAAFAVAAVQGYQGDNLAGKYTIAACLKHYIGYSLSEGGRDYHYSDVSDQTLWETFMPPYEAGVKAGAVTLMSAFNDISGVPASANYYTLTQVLKEQWGHTGFVVSDWGSIENLIPQGVAADRKEAAQKAFLSGVEMDMVDDVYVENLPKLVEEGKVPMSAIDEAVRRILRVKMQLGLFDQPYVDDIPDEQRYLLPSDLELAEKIATESMVLLKNENQTLPLNPKWKKLAVIGPMVKDSVNLMGSWEGMGEAQHVRTIYDGLLNEFSAKAKLLYSKGCDFEGNDTSGFKEALVNAKSADAVLLFLGEKKKWSGENGTRSTLALPSIQEELLKTLKSSGKPIILVLSSGRPIEMIRMEPLADAILEIWQPGTMGGPAVAGILSGRSNPSGKLSITFPRTTGQIPMYYNMRRPARYMGYYQDIDKEPMYWLGHGLSYTQFSHGSIQLSSSKISKSEKIIARIKVTNTGDGDGKETLLWYVSDPVATISRPIKEIKYFQKKLIAKGESEIYEFEIDPMRDLSYFDKTGERHLEPGEFILRVGDQKVTFELTD
ncbi:glycoside hydrolase family 3 N-terminal domain-containing protein [Reichenbachiella ulvae]|uniref:beta-glucosidase n=1 Tax=Reichenbachiella ulvae TaxID=2980104 RepID=A0ABT3CUP2_9BACT|nr:glycoside hydrolase family 3 N-terminal domain-containing protein [Reichenbachiella ulvae]MCV9387415.1 glycoside hydrolase family 3 C-terminal domain-containing protein [Reichenbachiella ulvae]